MSWKCDQHGELESEWCEECQRIYPCDCSTDDVERSTHIEYGGKWTTRVWITYCPCCGNLKSLETAS